MLTFPRLMTTEGKDPFQVMEWTHKDVEIKDTNGKVIYKCEAAEFPLTWSALARQIVASRYFRIARDGEGPPEKSVRSMVARVVNFITEAGVANKYFDTEQGEIFKAELTAMLLNQMGTFNSPVWFNVGTTGAIKPQGSACFINKVEDDMLSILQLAVTEGLIFKEGSGSGVNYSALRGENETIRGGGTASGPVSFLTGYDAFAGIILSGGRTRRAARMCTLDVDHPDIFKFIQCKAKEEDIVAILAQGGMTTQFNAPDSAYGHVKYQNGNHSVMVTDEFMAKVRDVIHGYKPDGHWDLFNRKDGSVAERVSIKELFYEIASAAHKCGDPALQFYNTINEGNTCAEDGNIVSSNPCSEFMFLENSACNLASINLAKFQKEPNHFDTKMFKHVVQLLITSQDILVDACGYPTTAIEENSHKWRPLGLGFSNLGGLLMSWGVPYNSDEGRSIAASITSLMTGCAYTASADLAETLGPFDRFEANKSSMEDVLERQMAYTKRLENDPAGIYKHAQTAWREALTKGFGKKRSKEGGAGFRNAQATLIAPTGTISFMMDCATTGVEPDIGLRKTKALVEGGELTYINPMAKEALKVLEYTEDEQHTIGEYIKEHGHVENCMSLKPQHLDVFDCAAPAHKRYLSADAHLDMVAAIQPFLSGAISKTYNLPHDATVDDVALTYLKAWERKIKCIAIYRKDSKLSDPLSVAEVLKTIEEPVAPKRKRMPSERTSCTHKFEIGSHSGYITVGFYEDGTPGELFLRMASHGSMVSGLLDAFATSCSIMLQYGVPLKVVVDKFKPMQFTPAGITTHPEIPIANSIINYVFRWLELKFLQKDDEVTASMPSILPEPGIEDLNADCCADCGNPMTRHGTCLQCHNCGNSQGVCS